MFRGQFLAVVPGLVTAILGGSGSTVEALSPDKPPMTVTAIARDDHYSMPNDEMHRWFVTKNDSLGAAGLNHMEMKVQFLHGTPTFNSKKGGLTYLPHPGFEGTDTATYYLVANDGQISNTATITITVGSPDQPKATDDDKATAPKADHKAAPKDGAASFSADPEETAAEDTDRDAPEVVTSPDPDAESTHQSSWLWPTVGGGVLALVAAGLIGRAALRRRA